MKKIMHKKIFEVALITAALCLAAGCATPTKTATKTYYFFPPPPDEPHLQYLVGFSSEKAFGGGQKKGLMSFLTGVQPVNRGFGKPYGAAAHGKMLYVCDTDAHAVFVVDLQVKRIGILNTPGAGAPSLPLNIAIDTDGTCYIADSGREQVVIIDKNGNYAGALGKSGEMRPRDVAVNRDRLYVADMQLRGVRVYDKTSRKLLFNIPQETDKANTDRGIFMPTNLALDSEGRVYVADTGGSRVQVYDAEGKYLRTVGGVGDSPGRFARLKGVAVDRDNRLYTVDALSAVIQIFNEQGRPLTWFGDPEASSPLQCLPAKVLVDYDDVALFQNYVAPDFKVEYLVFVINQIGYQMVSVYGFGHQK